MSRDILRRSQLELRHAKDSQILECMFFHSLCDNSKATRNFTEIALSDAEFNGLSNGAIPVVRLGPGRQPRAKNRKFTQNVISVVACFTQFLTFPVHFDA